MVKPDDAISCNRTAFKGQLRKLAWCLWLVLGEVFHSDGGLLRRHSLTQYDAIPVSLNLNMEKANDNQSTSD
jgi:hypothetical protein